MLNHSQSFYHINIFLGSVSVIYPAFSDENDYLLYLGKYGPNVLLYLVTFM